MLTLYQHPLSTYAMKVKISLREKGIPFTPILPDGMADGSAAGEFVAASPRAEIPTLIDGDVQVFDSTVILEYIEDKWPEPPLRATTPAAKARTRMIEDLMDCQYEPNNWGTMEVLRAKRATGPLADKLVAFGRSNIERLQRWLDGQLGDAPWFHGDTFGLTDIVVAPYIARSLLNYGYEPATPRLASWLERTRARPAVAQTIDEMCDVFAKLPDFPALIAEGKIRRQYRDHRLEWMIAGGGIDVVREGIEKGSIRFSRIPE